jgi:hypothetical protein
VLRTEVQFPIHGKAFGVIGVDLDPYLAAHAVGTQDPPHGQKFRLRCRYDLI